MATGWVVWCLLALGGAAGAAKKPHILWILADDFGWAEIGFHRNPPTHEVQTPNMDALTKNGLQLNEHYVFKFCSPTRSAIQSGRNPVHVNVLNLAPTVTNHSDPVSGFAAIPRNMTGIAEHMKRAGYKTHQVGKWDAGMATPDHTPQGRGYDTSLGYFHHANDYWTNFNGKCSKENIVDLWETNRPAHELNNSATCSQKHQKGCTYEDELFTEAVTKVVEDHDPTTPLFMFWAPHIVHTPLEVPQAYYDKFGFIDTEPRRYYHAMVNFLDDAIGNVTNLLKQKGMWEDTLVVFHADNGGPIYNFGDAGANNYPLRGGKMSNWQGGIRVSAWASGGFLPESVRGTTVDGYICGWDWYATFAHLAGVDPTDHRAAAAGLPPIDSHNMWPMISGKNLTSPRTEFPIGDSDAHGRTLVGGVISGEYKILVGELSMAGWTGPQFPNSSSHWDPSKDVKTCGINVNEGCLFNIKQDPTEHVNLAHSKPEVWSEMMNKVFYYQSKVFSPYRGKVDPLACEAALGKYKGFWGPFLP